MKISYNWLKEFIDLDLTPRDLAAKLTMSGLAVDSVEERSGDYILEFDLTSNRPDCLSHLGIAREAAALCVKPLRLPPAALSPARTKASEVAGVEILDSELCPRYTARVIRGVKIGPSPAWLAERLEAMGQRSVNNIADITNYVMLEVGQPLHAFDLERLKDKRIVVRRARAGERITTLDGEERELTPEMLVIADAQRAVALAGIKGGEDSGISETTEDVLLEAAYFKSVQVRATSKALGLSTEASYRFERGTDPEIVALASDRAAALIAEIAGGEVLDGLIDVYPKRSARGPIVFRRARYEALTGLAVKLGEAERILQDLGFKVDAEVEQDSLKAIPPSWRTDIGIEEDLIEEVARIAGYDKLATTLPGSAGAGAYLKDEDRRRSARNTLVALGYSEAINFSFVNEKADDEVSEYTPDLRLALENPIDETQSHMRTVLLGGLLKSLEHNFNRGTRNVRMFEIGKCFLNVYDVRPDEIERLALVATGARNEADWRAARVNLDFYEVKGAIELVCENLGLPPLDFAPAQDIPYLHPGRAALISLGGYEVGRIGQLHPQVGANYKFRQPVFVAELVLRELLSWERAQIRYQPLPKFPAVIRDLALLIDAGVPYAEIEGEISDLAIPELVSVRLFDLYEGKDLPSGKHSIALSLRYQAVNRTLTDDQVNLVHERVVNTLKRRFAAEIR